MNQSISLNFLKILCLATSLLLTTVILLPKTKAGDIKFKNSSFEESQKYWQYIDGKRAMIQSGSAATGKKYLKLQAGKKLTQVRSLAFKVSPNSILLCSFFYRASLNAGRAKISIRQITANGKSIAYTRFSKLKKQTVNWEQQFFKVNISAKTTSLQVYIQLTPGQGYIDFDDFTITRQIKNKTIAEHITAAKNTPNSYFLDFGAANSAVEPGFQLISPQTKYNPSNGVGWIAGKEKLNTAEYSKAQMAAYQKQRGAYYGDGRPVLIDIFLNDLSRDQVESETPGTLSLKLANGNYTVYLIAGSARKKDKTPFFDTAIKFNGKDNKLIQIPRSWTYLKRQYQVQVTDGKLDIQFSTPSLKWVVNGLIVYPEKADKQFAPIIKYFNDAVTFLPDAQKKFWKRITPDSQELGIKPTPKQLDTGLLIAEHNLVVDAYPNRAPQKTDSQQLIVNAALGETVPFALALYALKDISIKSLTTTTLKKQNGQKITASIKWRKMCYGPIKRNPYSQNAPAGEYMIKAEKLLPIKQLSIRAKNTARLIGTLSVPSNCQPGVYSAIATFTTDQNKTITLPININIMPFTLQQDHSISYSGYVRIPLYDYLPRYKSHPKYKLIEKRFTTETNELLQCLHEYGINSLPIRKGLLKIVNNEYVPNKAAFDEQYQLYKKYDIKLGLYHFSIHGMISRYDKISLPKVLVYPVKISESTYNRYGKAISKVAKMFENAKQKDLILQVFDEPYTIYGQNIAQNAYKQIKKIQKAHSVVKIFQTSNLITWLKMAEYINIPTIALGPVTMLDRTLKRVKSTGQRAWVYPNVIACGNAFSPQFARFIYGMIGWKYNLSGYIPWALNVYRGDPGNAFDSNYSGGNIMHLSEGNKRPTTTTTMEGMRQGIYDHRYLYTLEKLIKTKASTLPRLTQMAVDDLAALKKTIPDYLQFMQRLESLEFEAVRWSSKNMNLMRELASEYIIALQQGKPTPRLAKIDKTVLPLQNYPEKFPKKSIALLPAAGNKFTVTTGFKKNLQNFFINGKNYRGITISRIIPDKKPTWNYLRIPTKQVTGLRDAVSISFFVRVRGKIKYMPKTFGSCGFSVPGVPRKALPAYAILTNSDDNFIKVTVPVEKMVGSASLDSNPDMFYVYLTDYLFSPGDKVEIDIANIHYTMYDKADSIIKCGSTTILGHANDKNLTVYVELGGHPSLGTKLSVKLIDSKGKQVTQINRPIFAKLVNYQLSHPRLKTGLYCLKFSITRNDKVITESTSNYRVW